MKLIILIILLLNPLNKLDTPQKISNFMIANIRYSLDLEELLGCDYLQTVEQTLKLKFGDCDDMAILSNYYLRKARYKSNIYYINFNNRKGGHAIVIFKQGRQYSLFSNQYLIKTNKIDIIEAIKSEYKDVKKIHKIIKSFYGKNPKYRYIVIK